MAAFLAAYPAATDGEVKKAYHDLSRDANFVGHRIWAQMQTTTGKSPAYLYLFSHVPPQRPGGRSYAEPMDGAAHGAELFYVFNNLRYTDWPWTDVDRRIADDMSNYWVNFAKALDPNGPGLTRWPAYKPNSEQFLNIDDQTRVETINRATLDLLATRQGRARIRALAQNGAR
jgi:para-nitrobenzyl esterase